MIHYHKAKDHDPKQKHPNLPLVMEMIEKFVNVNVSIQSKKQI